MGRDRPHATFLPPDLGSFCRLDELGLQVVGQRLEPGRAVLACRVVETDELAGPWPPPNRRGWPTLGASQPASRPIA